MRQSPQGLMVTPQPDIEFWPEPFTNHKYLEEPEMA
jgi:hypothetical protein